MRAILVDWLVQVNDKFRLLQETLFLAVSFLDRYLAVSILINTFNIGGFNRGLLPEKRCLHYKSRTALARVFRLVHTSRSGIKVVTVLGFEGFVRNV